MSMQPIRARGVEISLNAFLDSLGFPPDCTIGWIGQGESPWTVLIRLESKLFDEVDVDKRIPRYEPTFEMRNGRPKLIDWGKPLE